ncbi:MAG: recombinase family protein [Clostridia bacterium]|nr:recombinase family protein [Clostridia bacterium]
MTERFDIAGYCRISVDDELDRDNVSIENQKAIIADFVRTRFPGSSLTFYEDRDRSGYTFEQREGYQRLRRELMAHKYDILVVKDFSRFSRRNSRGLVELEDLRDAGLRIISIGDGIDFPSGDDWLKIQFQFLINEMPVTDTSKKVRSVIQRRQADGKWICAAPYGYLVNRRQAFEVVPEEAEVVREIFRLYNEGWGYKRIAAHLTEQGVPTPRTAERERKLAAGEECRRQGKAAWAIVTVQGILDNDFYIGTLRQGKTTRAKINGKDVKRDLLDQIVIERHHEAIVDDRTFATARALRRSRTTSHYRGVKKYDNVYSGLLTCGDCGSPMFAMSRADLKDAYRCGEYHKRDRAACTSHHIRVDKLDEVIKLYLRKVKDNAAAMLTRLNEELAREEDEVACAEQVGERLEEVLAALTEEWKATKRQRVRDILRCPGQEAMLEETYDALEADLLRRMEGVRHQLQLAVDKRNTVIRVNRTARCAMAVFDEMLAKERLERGDLELIVERILVYEDRLEVQLKADIDGILRCGLPGEGEAEVAEIILTGEKEDEHALDPVERFRAEAERLTRARVVQSSMKRQDRVFDVNLISEGEPLEIYTDRDGEVIFKKYSPVGELSALAGACAEALSRTAGCPVVVCDRDVVITAVGGARKELEGKMISPAFEAQMEERQPLVRGSGEEPAAIVEGMQRSQPVAMSPILLDGDVIGAVALLGDGAGSEVELKLSMAAAAFLARQLET